MDAIIVALITGGLSLLGVVITNMMAARRTEQRMITAQAVTDARLEELTREVRAHNNFAQRVPVRAAACGKPPDRGPGKQNCLKITHRDIGGKIMDFASFGIASVACITVICYLAATAIKQTPLANKWLPSICGALGGLLGVAAMYINVPDFPAADPLTALAVGIVSGLAATGADQVIKQAQK